MTSTEYHGIIVREGFRDQALLNTLHVIGKKTGSSWTMLKIRVKPQAIEDIVRIIQENLLTENDIPYYAHLYRNNELIVIFPLRIFHVTPVKVTWHEIISYGKSLGIPPDELDFKPARVEDETF